MEIYNALITFKYNEGVIVLGENRKNDGRSSNCQGGKQM